MMILMIISKTRKSKSSMNQQLRQITGAVLLLGRMRRSTFREDVKI